MTPSSQILQQISQAFTVAHIMVDVNQLDRRNKYNEIGDLFSKYDIVPYPKQGEIEGYFQKGSRKYKSLHTQELLSDSTNLLDLLDLLSKRKFYFIIKQNCVCGYVHFSDLNNPIVKLPLFVLFEAMENKFWPKINEITQKAELADAVGIDRAKKILGQRKKLEKEGTDMGWTGLLYFDDILKLAKYYGLAIISDSEIRLLTSIRNRVAHSDKPLILHYLDVQRIVGARDLFEKFLG